MKLRKSTSLPRDILFSAVLLCSLIGLSFVGYGCNVHIAEGPCLTCVLGGGGCQSTSFGWTSCIQNIETGTCRNAGFPCP